MDKLEIIISNKSNKIISKPVENIDKKHYMNLIEQMKKICLEKKLYAVAAPQFGIYERFILIMTPEEITKENLNSINYTVTPYFNPVINKKIGLQSFYEGCASVPNAVGKVYRPYMIELEAEDIDGNIINRKIEGFEAIIFSHEIDHLDGIEYTEKAIDMHYDVYDYDEILRIRKEHPHQIIDTTTDYNQIKIPNL